MGWGSESAPLHRGRHRAVRSDYVGRALRRALLVTLVPALILSLAGWITYRFASQQVVDLVLERPATLFWVVVGAAVLWVLWITLICRTYSRHRRNPASAPLRFAGALGVLVMCGAVTAPMAVGAQYALVTRDVFKTVFEDQTSATTPDDVTAENPWGERKRVNVLLLGGDGAIHRPGVRTDSVILASINTKTGGTVLFSLPRNLQRVPFQEGSKLAELYPDGYTDGTADNAEFFLNAIYRNVPAVHPGVLGRSDNEGADAVKLAVAGALGIRVDYYVLVNLAGFEKLVDAIGGITVNINTPVAIGGNSDAGIPPDDYLQPGPNQRLNGFQALWFTRGRYGASDYQRMERQRCAINAIAEEASPLKVFRRYTKLAGASKEIVRTDIPRKLLRAFVDLAGKVKGKPIKSVGFERSDEFDPNDPDFDYVHAAVEAALHPVRTATPASPSDGSSPSSGSTASSGSTSSADVSPSKASNADDDCAYVPEDSTSG